MKKFYGTFGLGHEYRGKIQPIYAIDRQEAEKKMIEVHGDQWAFLYTEKEFSNFLREGFYTDAEMLPTISSYTDMTVGEMRKWTKRFKQILNGPEELKNKRLTQLMLDLERTYQIPFMYNEDFNRRNPFVIQFYRTVVEARSNDVN